MNIKSENERIILNGRDCLIFKDVKNGAIDFDNEVKNLELYNFNIINVNYNSGIKRLKDAISNAYKVFKFTLKAKQNKNSACIYCHYKTTPNGDLNFTNNELEIKKIEI